MPSKLGRPVRLRPEHIVEDFESGERSLDEWLKKVALAASAGRTASTFVVCRQKVVLGYYSLATASIAHNQTNAKLRRNAPDPIPAVLLARVAVSTKVKGQGLGRDLVNDAMRRTLVAARHVAARTLLVHALNPNAVAFYRRLGFAELPHPNNFEVIPMHIELETVARALKMAAGS